MTMRNQRSDREYDKFVQTSGGDTAVRVLSTSGGIDFEWDYISLATAATTDTYTFKTGGAGGTTVAIITITYTDATKETISTVVKT